MVAFWSLFDQFNKYWKTGNRLLVRNRKSVFLKVYIPYHSKSEKSWLDLQIYLLAASAQKTQNYVGCKVMWDNNSAW